MSDCETFSTNFEKACSKTLNLEGVYSNDRNDTGGETAFGIARNYHPDWAGWAIIDDMKPMYSSHDSFVTALNMSEKLSVLVKDWYKKEFWNPFQLDNIKDEKLAFEIFDQSVNLGRKQTTLFIQRSCNALNYNYTFGPDLVIDGIIGPSTRSRLQAIGNDARYTDCLRKALDGLQTSHYINLGLKTSSSTDYRKYMRGWLINRVGEVDLGA